MRIASVLENQNIEKRIAITPEIAKKYISLGFEISLTTKYGEHLGFKDSEYKDLGVEISSNETEILSKANIIIQLSLLSDENLSNLKENQTFIGVLNPYANKEKIENLKNWFKMKYEIIYFYNVYGPKQISIGNMATVIGIFENAYKNKKPLPVVRPGTQSRKFTHISDTVKVCYDAWKKDKCRHYSISSKKDYSILEVAKLFGSKIKLLPARDGERYASALTNMNLSNKVFKNFGRISLKTYIEKFKNRHKR
jgi:UDP-glucose 4-epimerase